MSLPWFRFDSNAVDNDKLRLLAFEDRWHFAAILCCKAQGILDVDAPMKMIRRRVAVKLGVDMQSLDEIVRRLSEVDLICTKSLQPKGWDERQFVSDHSAERVRKYRKSNESCNDQVPLLKRGEAVSVTPPHTHTHTHTQTQRNTPPTPFEIFWNSYPRKTGKDRAEKSFRAKGAEEHLEAILGNIRQRCEYERAWRDGDKEYIPHPSTYLNGKMWNDEVIRSTAYSKKKGPQTYDDFVAARHQAGSEEGRTLDGTDVAEVLERDV